MRPARSAVADLGLLFSAIVLTFVVQATRTELPDEAREAHLFPAWHRPDVTRLAYERDGQRFVLERALGETEETSAGPDWRLAAPVEEPAEAHQVATLLGRLEVAKVLRRLEKGAAEPAETGLDAPRATLEVDAGARSYRVRLGGPAVGIEPGAYAELVAPDSAPELVVVAADTAADLLLELRTFRELRLLRMPASKLSRIDVEGPAERFALERRGAGWQLANGRRVERAWIERALLGLETAPKERFIDFALGEKLSKGAPTTRLALAHGGEPTASIELTLGGACDAGEPGSVVLRRSPPAASACLPKRVAEAWNAPAAALEDTRLVFSRFDEIDALEVDAASERLRLSRSDAAFELRVTKKSEAPNPREPAREEAQTNRVELETGSRVLERLVRARGRIVPAPEAANRGATPSYRVRVTAALPGEDQTSEEKYSIWSPGAGAPASKTLFVERHDDGAWLEVPRTALTDIAPSATTLRSRSVLEIPQATFRRVEVRTADGVQRVRRTGPGTFELELPAGFAHDGGLVADLMQTLGNLEAERWVAATDDRSYGFEKPDAVVRLELDPKKHEPELELRIGGRSDDGWFATLGDGRGVFVVSESVRSTIHVLLLDRSVLMAEPERVQSLSIKTVDHVFSARRLGEVWVEAAGTEPAPGAALTLLDTLATLRVEGAVHVGGPRPGEGFLRPLLALEVEIDELAAPGHKTKRFRIGSGDAWNGISVHYVRVDGLDATYAVARSQVLRLLDALAVSSRSASNR